jgi:hypothetical protein
MMTLLPVSMVRGRKIGDADVSALAELLRKGFPHRSRGYWLEVFDRLAKHCTPVGRPKYGYLIENSGSPVGVVLLISSLIQENGKSTVRCNVSTWYVEPDFRSHAPLLVSQATREKNVTYFNITPAKHTQPILEAQGFSRYSDGQFVAPVFPMARRHISAQVTQSHICPDAPFDPSERDLLLAHAEYGCISVWCTTSERAYPFVFLPRLVKNIVPCVQLIYCRHIDDFVQFVQPLGWYLGLRGRPFVLIDSKGPIRELAGKYFSGIAPKYFKGPISPRLGDLAYTEAAILPRLYENNNI